MSDTPSRGELILYRTEDGRDTIRLRVVDGSPPSAFPAGARRGSEYGYLVGLRLEATALLDAPPDNFPEPHPTSPRLTLASTARRL